MKDRDVRKSHSICHTNMHLLLSTLTYVGHCHDNINEEFNKELVGLIEGDPIMRCFLVHPCLGQDYPDLKSDF